MKPGQLFLDDGTTFSGVAPFDVGEECSGEVVFTTGMVGYVESLTDPSYFGQILVFTYPLIGNYGVPPKEQWESQTVHAKGVILSEPSPTQHHYEAASSLVDWLKDHRIGTLTGVDTRALTKHLRSQGSPLGAISTHELWDKEFYNPNDKPLAKSACNSDVVEYGSGTKKIILIDCGVKENIVRSFLRFPLKIKRVPFDYNFTQEDYDGLFISNGPGNPVMYPKTIEHIASALKQKKPIFGICLGIQLLALAAKAKTYKLPYGHRGQNQPCIDLLTNRSYLTSQNHGYAIEEDSLPSDWKVTFRNLNDNSIEGISHKNLPFSAVQFHPEAYPGPTDTMYLFEEFYENL